MLRPTTRVKLGLRAALRRRYQYAALRVLRRSVAAALLDNLERSTGSGVFVSERDAISLAYWQGLQRLKRRWGALNLEDERARP